jgi:tetratricopeptide (TPR) repeat protein
MKGLGIIANQFVYEGIQYFNSKDYPHAYNCFVKNLEIGRMPSINQLDTIIIYNTAISAEKAGNLIEAASYYEELIKMKYGGVQMYNDLAKVLRQVGHDEKFLRTIETGIRSYPDESFNLYSEIINYYLEKNDLANAFSYTETAIKSFANSAGLHFLYASLNEANGKNDIAETEYKKTIELDAGFTDAYFNLGSMYYNIGVDLLKKAMTKDEKNKADSYYKDAMGMFEKVYEQTPDNQETIKILSNLYGYFNMTDKQALMQSKLN